MRSKYLVVRKIVIERKISWFFPTEIKEELIWMWNAKQLYNYEYKQGDTVYAEDDKHQYQVVRSYIEAIQTTGEYDDVFDKMFVNDGLPIQQKIALLTERGGLYV